MPVDTYLELLNHRANALLDHDPGAGYPVSLAASWAIAFDRLENDDTEALELLTLIAWLGAEPVSLSLLVENPSQLPANIADIVADALALARCTTILQRRGMATIARSTVHLHRIPALLLRHRRAEERSDVDLWPRVAVRLLRNALPADVHSPTTWPLWEQLLPHILALVDIMLQLKSDDDLVVRLGGDEFAILRPAIELGTPDEPTLKLLAMKIREVLHDHILYVSTPHGPRPIGQIGVAASTATFPKDGADIDALMAYALAGLKKPSRLSRASADPGK